MIIVRAKDSNTGVVYEYTSEDFPGLLRFQKNSDIIREAYYILNERLKGTDNDFDSIEVVAR